MGTLQIFESSDVIGVTEARLLLKQRALQPPIGTPDLETLAAAEVWVCARTGSGTDNQPVVGARRRALLSANQEQIRLYHDIGQVVLDLQRHQGWGARVIDRLSSDLRAEFPDMKGLSASNLKYMPFFASECPGRFSAPVGAGVVSVCGGMRGDSQCHVPYSVITNNANRYPSTTQAAVKTSAAAVMTRRNPLTL
jgi:DUF1016 N-terminal domain